MASRLTEISLDCHDPDRLAEFWTAALDWVVLEREPGLVEVGPARATDQALLDAVRSGPVPPTMFLAAVGEGKVVKNRMHWDVQTDDLDGLIAGGATVVREPDDEIHWTVMHDPQGNEFCAFSQ